MADGRVEIDTRLDTGNIRRDVQRVNNELSHIGDGVAAATRGLTDEVGARYDSLGRRIRYAYRGTSEEARRMYSEMRSAHYQQSIAMRGVKDQMIGAQYQYFKLAQASQNYTGTTREFLAEVQRVGKAQKAATDAAINSNRLAMMGMLQTIGYMQNMTTQATRIRENYTRMANPLYTINNAGLRAADALNRMANAGNASVLALKMLGPTASMKDLQNMTMMINQGLMRFQMVALAAAASSVLLYGALHKSNMEMNPKYAEAYTNMLEKLSKAFQPMKDAFAAMMIPIYNFISAIADLVIKFNEAHPVLAKFIQGTMMLIPLLTLILSPLAIGIGLWNGMLAAWSSIWMLIGPLITGLAAMSATVWVVAAAVVGLVMYLSHLWKTNEQFRAGVMKSLGAVKQFGQAIAALGKYLFWTAVDGDYLNDWITHLPESFQPAAEKIGRAVAKIHDAVSIAIDSVARFGQHIVNLGKYLFWTAVDGDYLNDWITHLPEGFQNAAQAIGMAIAKIREVIVQLVDAVKSAFQGNFDPLIQFFVTLIPNIIALIIGGIPGLIIGITTMFARMSDGVNTGGTQLVTKFGEIVNNIVTAFTTFISTQLPTIVEQGVKIIVSIIQGISQALPQLVLAITQVITTFITGLVTLLPQIVTVGINLIQTLVAAITQALPQIILAAVQIINALVQGIVQVLPMIVNAAIQIITTLIQAIIPLIPQLLDAGIQILMALINGIIQCLPQIITAILQVIQTLVNTIVTLLPQIIDAGIKILMALIDGIIQILPQLIETAIMLITKVCDMLIQNLPKLIDAGIKILMALIDGIIQVLPQLIDAAIKIIVKLVEVLIQNLPKIIEAGVKILTALIDGIIKILPKLIETGLKLIVEIAKAIIDNLPKILEAGGKIILELIKGIIALVGKLGSTIKDSVVKSMTDKLDDAKDTFFKAGQGLMDMLKDGLISMKDKVLGTMSDIAGKVRDFLPFSPAKTGPLSDLDHLDFGGPISDSIKLAFPKVSGLMSELLDLPDITANAPAPGLQNRAVNTTNNNTPISVTLNYNGNGNENDMMHMVDMIEGELSRRLATKQFMLGGR